MYDERQEYLIKEIKKYNDKASDYHKLMIFDTIVTNILLLSSIFSFNSFFEFNHELFQQPIAAAYGFLAGGLTVEGVSMIIKDFYNKKECMDESKKLYEESMEYEQPKSKVLKKQ